jgi:hypothetical protein
MTSILRQLYYQLRQKTFPPEFRLAVEGAEDWAGALATAVAAELARAQSQGPAGESIAPAGINPAFMLGLCNYYFRLHRNAQLLGDESFELRRIHDTLEDLEDLLRQHQVECRDLTGQDFDPRSEDFEPLGEPQPTPGLSCLKIGACERPAVFIGGQLHQRAKGLVLKPR